MLLATNHEAKLGMIPQAQEDCTILWHRHQSYRDIQGACTCHKPFLYRRRRGGGELFMMLHYNNKKSMSFFHSAVCLFKFHLRFYEPWYSILPVSATVWGSPGRHAPFLLDSQMLPAACPGGAAVCPCYTAVHCADWLLVCASNDLALTENGEVF